MRIEVVGVYSVSAPQPCHLVEVIVHDLGGELQVAEFTQETPGEPRNNWQAPWDEYVLDASGTSGQAAPFPGPISAKGDVRLAFFLHYLDPSKPLLTPIGPVDLPPPQERPPRLAFMTYEPPD